MATLSDGSAARFPRRLGDLEGPWVPNAACQSRVASPRARKPKHTEPGTALPSNELSGRICVGMPQGSGRLSQLLLSLWAPARKWAPRPGADHLRSVCSGLSRGAAHACPPLGTAGLQWPVHREPATVQGCKRPRQRSALSVWKPRVSRSLSRSAKPKSAPFPPALPWPPQAGGSAFPGLGSHGGASSALRGPAAAREASAQLRGAPGSERGPREAARRERPARVRTPRRRGGSR